MIYFFHGSPGTAGDFKHLQSELKDKEVLSFDRNNQDQVKMDKKGIVVAYSFGCFKALEALNENISTVYFISPFLFPTKALSPVLKTIVSIPGVSHFILGKLGAKGIDRFLLESCKPSDCPDIYLEDGKKYKDYSVLKNSILEKTNTTEDTKNLLHKLEGKKLVIIRGSDDESCSVEKQIDPLRFYVKIAKDEVLKKGGHALLWTHTSEIADIINEGV